MDETGQVPEAGQPVGDVSAPEPAPENPYAPWDPVIQGWEPEAAQNARGLWDALSSRDHRDEALQAILANDLLPEGADVNWARQQLQQAWQQQSDPWQQIQQPQYAQQPMNPYQPQPIGYDPQTGEPVYDQQQAYMPPPQQFDPQTLRPVFDAQQQQIAAMRNELNQMRQQEYERQVQGEFVSSIQSLGLNDAQAGIVHTMARNMLGNGAISPKDAVQKAYAQFASAVGQQVANQITQQQQAPQSMSRPGGNPPAAQQPPRTVQEALDSFFG